MDPAAHRRFLEYLELWQMFGGPDRRKLDRAQWEALDQELAALVAEARAGRLSPEAEARVVALRRALLRD